MQRPSGRSGGSAQGHSPRPVQQFPQARDRNFLGGTDRNPVRTVQGDLQHRQSQRRCPDCGGIQRGVPLGPASFSELDGLASCSLPAPKAVKLFAWC